MTNSHDYRVLMALDHWATVGQIAAKARLSRAEVEQRVRALLEAQQVEAMQSSPVSARPMRLFRRRATRS